MNLVEEVQRLEKELKEAEDFLAASRHLVDEKAYSLGADYVDHLREELEAFRAAVEGAAGK